MTLSNLSIVLVAAWAGSMWWGRRRRRAILTNASFHGHPQLENKLGFAIIAKRTVSYSSIFQIFSFNYLEMVEKDYGSILRQKEKGNSTDPGEDDVQHSVVGGTQFIFVNYSH